MQEDTAAAADGTDGAKVKDEKEKPPLFEHLVQVSSTLNVAGPRRGQYTNKYTCNILTAKGICNGSITLYQTIGDTSETTSNAWTHLRQKVAAGCKAHEAVLEKLNETGNAQHSSCDAHDDCAAGQSSLIYSAATAAPQSDVMSSSAFNASPRASAEYGSAQFAQPCSADARVMHPDSCEWSCGAGRSGVDLSVSARPPAPWEGPGPLKIKQKQAMLKGSCAPLRAPARPCGAPLRAPARPCTPLRAPARPCAPLCAPTCPCEPLRAPARPCARG